MGLSHSAVAVGPWRPYTRPMRPLSYSGYRFPPEIIQHAIWLYLRFTLSFRDVEELLAERGIDVSHETIRRWVAVFGPMIARRLRAMRPKPHTTWHLDEMFVSVDRSSRLQMNAASGCNAHGGAPCLEGLGTEPTLRCRCDEMATDVESVVDRSIAPMPQGFRAARTHVGCHLALLRKVDVPRTMTQRLR